MRGRREEERDDVEGCEALYSVVLPNSELLAPANPLASTIPNYRSWRCLSKRIARDRIQSPGRACGLLAGVVVCPNSVRPFHALILTFHTSVIGTVYFV